MRLSRVCFICSLPTLSALPLPPVMIPPASTVPFDFVLAGVAETVDRCFVFGAWYGLDGTVRDARDHQSANGLVPRVWG